MHSSREQAPEATLFAGAASLTPQQAQGLAGASPRFGQQFSDDLNQLGITADQIISYLAAHAHEQMHRTAALTNKPVLPPTVVDQIRLWQLENERMKTTPGFLFKEFEDQKEYLAVACLPELTDAEEQQMDSVSSSVHHRFFVRTFPAERLTKNGEVLLRFLDVAEHVSTERIGHLFDLV